MLLKSLLWPVFLIAALTLTGQQAAAAGKKSSTAIDPALADIPLDPQLKHAISRIHGQRYLLYVFDNVGDIGTVRKAEWNGLFLLPDLWDRLKQSATVHRDESGNLVDWTYQARDQSFARVTMDKRTTNLLTFRIDGVMSSAWDTNSDRIIDFMDIHFPDNRRWMLIAELNGLRFFDKWLAGSDPLCRPIDPTALVKAGSTCNAPYAFGGGRLGGEKGAGGQDYLDQLCAERTRGPRRPFGRGMVAHRGPGYGGNRSPITVYPPRDTPGEKGSITITTSIEYYDDQGRHVSTYDEHVTYDAERRRTRTVHERRDHQGRGTRTITEHNPDGTTTTRRERIKPADRREVEDRLCETCPAYENSEPTRTGSGTSPSDPVDPDADVAWSEFCEARSRAGAVWYSSVAQLDQRAVATDCLDPVVNPNPAESQRIGVSKTQRVDCGPTTDDHKVSRDIAGFLRGQRGRGGENCGPTESPTPDGRCSGRHVSFGSGGGSGTLVDGFSEITAFDFCDPRNCRRPPR